MIIKSISLSKYTEKVENKKYPVVITHFFCLFNNMAPVLLLTEHIFFWSLIRALSGLFSFLFGKKLNFHNASLHLVKELSNLREILGPKKEEGVLPPMDWSVNAIVIGNSRSQSNYI